MESFDIKEVHNFEDLHKEVLASLILYDKQKIKKAYDFAVLHHKDNKRYDGSPLIYHLLTLAAYCIRLGLDSDSVVAALLHESLILKKTDLNTLAKEFGDDVALLVDGLTDIKSITAMEVPEQVEDQSNFRKLIISSTEDIRILIIRLANKIHDSFSLKTLPYNKRERAALRMINFYAPLCEFLGLGTFHKIFEDQSFEILNTNEYKTIKEYIENNIEKNRGALDELTDDIKALCEEYSIKYHDITFRTKGIRSIFNKIKRKHLEANEVISNGHLKKVKDLLGLRIIVETLEDCYATLGLVHGKWKYYPEEFDDYILKPKESGYKSIHTVINYLNIIDVEIQIRTHEMHEYNEFGPASHIAYKLIKSKGRFKESYGWTKELSEWRNDSYLEKKDYKIRVFAESIFVFTPKGKIIVLPQNSTPIDFAFKLHTELGCRYSGAKVNNKMVDMQFELKTGDVVEVITSKNYNLSKDWVKKAKSKYAKKKIRAKLKALGKWSG